MENWKREIARKLRKAGLDPNYVCIRRDLQIVLNRKLAGFSKSRAEVLREYGLDLRYSERIESISKRFSSLVTSIARSGSKIYLLADSTINDISMELIEPLERRMKLKIIVSRILDRESIARRASLLGFDLVDLPGSFSNYSIEEKFEAARILGEKRDGLVLVPVNLDCFLEYSISRAMEGRGFLPEGLWDLYWNPLQLVRRSELESLIEELDLWEELGSESLCYPRMEILEAARFLLGELESIVPTAKESMISTMERIELERRRKRET